MSLSKEVAKRVTHVDFGIDQEDFGPEHPARRS